MGNNWQVKLLLVIGIILFSSLHCCGLKRHRTSPKIVAQRTGAARFEEYFDDDNASQESKLKKRFSQDPDIEPADNDPEIYQGVLGRPGVDFPVMRAIPKTNFDCTNLGNGYFADLETSCQVFHICDEGRKISFLCPNGTIFRQIDLICDWWFKVDCRSAPEHYAESSEQLQRAQRLRQQKLRHVVRSEQGFGASGEIFFRNDARPAESIQKPAVRLPQGRAFRAPNSKINKRMDNNDDVANRSGENSNASEILYTRRNDRKGKSNEAKEKEIQETAETSSFVKDRGTYNGYTYPVPTKTSGYDYPKPEASNQYLPPQQGYSYPEPLNDAKLPTNAKPEKLKKSGPQPILSDPQPFNTRPTETSTTEIFATTVASLETAQTGRPVGRSLEPKALTATTAKPQTKSTAAASTVTRRGSTTYQSSLKANENKETVRSRIQAANSLDGKDFKATTPSYDSQKINTYSTARKPNGKTKETPFYTPTIPTVRENGSSTTLNQPTTTNAPETATQATNSEIVKHALEMMESLKGLDINPAEAERYMGQRSGLEVPPSSGPNALHSLALYFANGDTNNTKRMTEEQKARMAKQGIASVFLSDKTVTKYEELFPHERRSTEPSVTKYSDSTQSTLVDDDFDNDLETQHSKNPILSAAGTPQLREIAQVFTHALSAYLQDPEQFRKILSEIRPTQPPPVELNEIPRFPGENEFVRQESAYNIPRATGTTGKPEDLEIFDFSDVTAPTKPKDEETTTDSFEDSTTTESGIPSTTYYPQVSETLPPPSNSLADKTPGSRLLTENLEKSAIDNLNARTAKELDQTLRLPAEEINGGLKTVSHFNFGFDNSKESEETNYFPVGNANKSKLSPYGFGVKPENSTPINDPFPTSLSDTQAIPLRWGDELTTADPSEITAYPTVYADLLPPYDINGTEVFNIPSNDIQLPNEETDEHLQHAQSQSFVSSRNNIYTELKKSRTYNDYLNYNEEFLLGTTNFGEKIPTTTEIPQTTSIKGHFVTKSIPVTTTNAPETTTVPYSTTTSYAEAVKTTLPDSGTITANSKTTVSYTVFLDPLTINDGLMESEEDSTITPSPHTYLPRDLLGSSEVIDQAATTHASAQRRGKSPFATTPLTIRFAGDETNSIEPMQKRANEMFGNLNETQVNHLMNVMKKAEENKTVKRLILLLIQTCDGDDHNKTLEESRTALLNALIGMDNAGKNGQNEIKIINTRREKSLRTTTTTAVPITTYKSPNHEKYASSESAGSKELEDVESSTIAFEQTTIFQSRSNYAESESTTQDSPAFTTETEAPTTETQTTTTTTTTTTTEQPITFPTNSRSRSVETKPKFRLKSNASLKTGSGSVRHQKSLGANDEYVAEPSQTTSIEHKRADARALELLRSLYSLASRWGK